MLVILKIPVVLAGWIVWWAIKSEPQPADDVAPDDGGGGGTQPRPVRPRPPRRGDHGVPAPLPPQRVRARARRSTVASGP